MGETMQAAGAGEGNRTLVVSLEGFCSTIELHPPGSAGDRARVAGTRSPNPRLPIPSPETIPQATNLDSLVEEVGFEPT